MELSHSTVQNIGELYTSITKHENKILDEDSDFYNEEFANLFSDVLNTICISLVSEGYSAHAILDYLENTPDDDIIEKYINSDISIISEETVYSEYAIEQFEILSEALPLIAGAKLAAKVLGGAGARKAIVGGLSNVGRGLTVAAKRALGPGARKALGGVVSKVKGAAGGASNALKTAGKWAVGGAGFEAGSKAVKKMSGTGNEGDSSSSAAKPKPSSTSNTQVLAKLDGKQGVLDKTTGKFKSNKWDASEKDRYKEVRKTNAEKTQVEESYDAYDLVLEYLLSEGHADTVEEANYIMLEMNSEVIQDIVEQQTSAIRADAPRPGQRTVSMTATGKEPIGNRLAGQAGQAIGNFVRGINPKALKSTPAPEPRKPLVSTTKPKPSGLVDVSTAEKASQNLPGSRVYKERQGQAAKPGPSNNFGRGF